MNFIELFVPLVIVLFVIVPACCAYFSLHSDKIARCCPRYSERRLRRLRRERRRIEDELAQRNEAWRVCERSQQGEYIYRFKMLPYKPILV